MSTKKTANQALELLRRTLFGFRHGKVSSFAIKKALTFLNDQIVESDTHREGLASFVRRKKRRIRFFQTCPFKGSMEIITFPVSSRKWHNPNFHTTAYASVSSVKYLLLLPLRYCLIPLRTHNEITIVLKDHITGKFCTVVIP